MMTDYIVHSLTLEIMNVRCSQSADLVLVFVQGDTAEIEVLTVDGGDGNDSSCS